MASEETLEVNELIATFMGGKFYQAHYQKWATWHFEGWHGRRCISSGYTFEPNSLYYHKSYDWLMPVWNKIIHLNCVVSTIADPFLLTLVVRGKGDKIFRIKEKVIGKDLLETYYLVVMRFIKWHKQQNL